jgi:phosphopantothenoylcysteine decarboxylase/phosphopantothenate--cysteine ligase
MHCIVTAGPTYEPLDKVRRLTNFSTGSLGAQLAAFLSERGHDVTLLFGEMASYRGELQAASIRGFSTNAHLRGMLQSLSEQAAVAVFHAAAVSDFAFGRLWLRSEQGDLTEVNAGKISTRDGSLLAELMPTPKIIADLRHWFPKAVIVGWKYEVDGNREDVLRSAGRQLIESLTDACVANGPAYGEGFGLLKADKELNHLPDKDRLFQALEELIPR